MDDAARGSESVEELSAQDRLLRQIASRRAKVGVIGLGYVGIPLALIAARAGFPVLGFDVNEARVQQINRGESFIRHIAADAIRSAIKDKRFEATADFRRLEEVDAILICVPTPLTPHREPDLSFVVGTARAIAERLRPAQLVVLESTTYPGTTDEVLKPILEATGLKSGTDFFLAFSPEREDPGNEHFGTGTIPKVVGGDGPEALAAAKALYDALVVETVPVSSTATAEAVKLTENVFRAVNIALVNELKVVYDAMGIDVWEVIEAAKTKPFGFMPFYPGPAASAGTASRSIRSTSLGRRGSTRSRPASSSLQGRSTRACRTTSSSASLRRSTGGSERACRAQRFSLSASPSRRTSTTCARAPR